MAPVRPILRWLRMSDAGLPRLVRLVRREVARADARRRNGSIAAYMEAVVAEANRTPGP